MADGSVVEGSDWGEDDEPTLTEDLPEGKVGCRNVIIVIEGKNTEADTIGVLNPVYNITVCAR